MDLMIKEKIDKIYTNHPEFGHRRITIWLNREDGIQIERRTVLSHMQEMGIQAIYPRQNTSKPKIGNKIYPYLLQGREIVNPDDVWSIDITYIPIKKSWLYMVAIIDWRTRYVISYEIDDTLEIEFVLEACKRALGGAKPKIMNSDQGSHFTSSKYTELFLNEGVQISMDHRGRAFDNIFIERFWRTIKYEDIYIKGYEYPREARIGIRDFMSWYNNKRPHMSLDNMTPADIYFEKR